MLPHMADDVVRHYGFDAFGIVTGQRRPPAGTPGEQRGVYGHRQVLLVHHIRDSAQTVLPAIADSLRI